MPDSSEQSLHIIIIYSSILSPEMERNAQHCTVTATEFDCGFVYVAAGRRQSQRLATKLSFQNWR